MRDDPPHDAELTPEAWTPGGRVGDYLLQRPLGAGGMGEVWHAIERTTGGQRAIKTLLRSARPSHVQRFAREIEALTRVDGHPNVVRVHAAGAAAGRPYVVLDFAPGGDLAQRLERGPLATDEARRILAEVATGLAHVHHHGLLHRDLKPQNVLFAEDGRAMLTDFGVVRDENQEALTLSGQLIGTLSYMPPEQASGGKVDVRSDVYGLGAILHHTLTGEPPTSALLSGLRSPSDTNPSAPRDLVRVCMKATARNPNHRYRDAQAFADALYAPERQPIPVALWLALAVAGLGVAGVGWALSLRNAKQAAPPSQPSAASAGDTTAAPEEVRSNPEQDALDAFLASLPEPDPAQLPTGRITDEVVRGVSGLRAAGDGLRMRKLNRQAAAFYYAGAKAGDLDCWNRLARVLRDDRLGVNDVASVRRACLLRGAEEGSPSAFLRLAALHWLPNDDFPLDLPAAQRYCRRALELADELEASDPGRAVQIRREAGKHTVQMTVKHLDHPQVGSAIEALNVVSALEGLTLPQHEREQIRASARKLLAPAHKELLALFDVVEVPVAEELFEEADLLHLRLYEQPQRTTRLGILLLREGRLAEGVACLAQSAEEDGRAWYELYHLLRYPNAAQSLGLDPTRSGGVLWACVEAGSAGLDSHALNVLSKALIAGKRGWPLSPDPARATALARAALPNAGDPDLRAELLVRLSSLALDLHDTPGCPTLSEGRGYLVDVTRLKRVDWVEQVRQLDERYAAKEAE